MHSTQLTIGRDQNGTPNALYDGLNRLVTSFPTDRTHDTRRGSPSVPETIEANAKLFKAAPSLLTALKLTVAALQEMSPYLQSYHVTVLDTARESIALTA